METLFYLLKVVFTSGLLFSYYLLFLKDKTFHHYNRFYLLSILMISIFLPLIKVTYFTVKVNDNLFLLLNKFQSYNNTEISSQNFTPISITVWVLFGVAFCLLLRFIMGLIKIEHLKKSYSREDLQGISFYSTSLDEAPFSYFKNLFWKNSIPLDSVLGQQILKHEMVHIEQKHSWDKLVLEIINALFWFNPFFYLIKKEISLIHEYLADKKALKNSDTKAFARMLLASHFSGKTFLATSPLLHSNLKKRLTMLKKSKTKFSYARRIFALPVLFAVTFIYMVNAKNKEIKNTNLEVENMISTLKSDTISPNNQIQMSTDDQSLEAVQTLIGEKQNEIQPLQESFNAKNEEARRIGDDLRLKSDELKKLSDNKEVENPKYKKLDMEINQLGAKMDEIYNKEDFKKVEKMLNEKFGEMDQLYAKLDSFYNSDAFKNSIREAENQAADAERVVNSPQFRKQIKDAEKAGKAAEKMVNSKKFQTQMKELEKQALTAEKQAEIAQKVAAITEKNLLNLNKNYLKIDQDEVNYYIDGKLSDKKSADQLDPGKIESMNIFKKGFEGRDKGEIQIKLKR